MCKILYRAIPRHFLWVQGRAGHKMRMTSIWLSVIKPARSKTRTSLTDPEVEILQLIHENLAIFICFSYLSYPRHPSLLVLQTKTRRWATLLLSSCSSPITWRHSWAPRWTFLCMLSATAQKVPRAKNGTFWFAWMDSHDSTTILYLLCCSTVWDWNKVFWLSDSRVTWHQKIWNISTTVFFFFFFVFLKRLSSTQRFTATTEQISLLCPILIF